MPDYVCQFVGGSWDGKLLPREAVMDMRSGLTEDMTEWRNHGAIVDGPELDNQPTFEGYLGPKWGGEIQIGGEDVGVLRYETQEVYDLLSM